MISASIRYPYPVRPFDLILLAEPCMVATFPARNAPMGLARPVGIAIGPGGALYFTSGTHAAGLFRKRLVTGHECP